jgi:hypothetical protein
MRQYLVKGFHDLFSLHDPQNSNSNTSMYLNHQEGRLWSAFGDIQSHVIWLSQVTNAAMHLDNNWPFDYHSMQRRVENHYFSINWNRRKGY